MPEGLEGVNPRPRSRFDRPLCLGLLTSANVLPRTVCSGPPPGVTGNPAQGRSQIQNLDLVPPVVTGWAPQLTLYLA